MVEIVSIHSDAHLQQQASQLLFDEWANEYRIFDGIHTAQELCERVVAQNTCLAAIDDDGAVLGVAMISKDDWGVRPDLVPWLSNVCVHRSRRGCGIGTKLVRAAMERVRNGSTIYLWTYTDRLVEFYRRFGFKVIDTIPQHHHMQNVTVMAFSTLHTCT